MVELWIISDENGYYDFYGRCQSTDRVLAERILQEAESQGLKILYSPPEYRLLCGLKQKRSGARYKGKLYLVAVGGCQEKLSKADKVIVVKWNRSYPGCRILPDLTSNSDWILSSEEELVGSSHERITITKYERRQQR